MKSSHFGLLFLSILIIFGGFSALLWFLPLSSLPLYDKNFNKECARHQVKIPLVLVIIACASAVLCASLNFVFVVGIYLACRKQISSLLDLIKQHLFELMDMLLRLLMPTKLLKIVSKDGKK
ncbi:unnamed protein product [Meloidogyne enterolobii]|uniref:Uncharacterized protein n=2 Tax=Meloidogyne enterolobii TaxID=390850 RepID=A0A6V7UAH5_MELEN|nr:unnamed protein product [Meloidogyne enterolobii]